MLVLARKLDEVIYIGDNIKITVVALQPGMVKLGIDAPSNVTIMRKELLPVGKMDLRAQQPKMARNNE